VSKLGIWEELNTPQDKKPSSHKAMTLFARRNLDESGGIYESVNNIFHPGTVKSGWFFNPSGEDENDIPKSNR